MTSALDPGTAVGGYELLEATEADAPIRTWRAKHSTTDKAVSIQAPNYALLSEPVADGALTQQKEILTAINDAGGHSTLPELREVVKTHQREFLIIDSVSGDALGEKVVSGPGVSIQEAISLTIEVCDAFSFLYRNEICYQAMSTDGRITYSSKGIPARSIGFLTPTPSEVFITDNPASVSTLYPTTVVGAKSSLDRNSEFWAGVAYEPPEIRREMSSNELGPWSTVYSIGKLLFFMITGRCWEGPSHTPGEVGCSCPEYLNQIIGRATAADPSDRYGSATSIRHALERETPHSTDCAVLHHPGTGSEYVIKDGDTIGGGDLPKTHLTIEDLYLSPVHCQFLEGEDGNWILTDTSTNGTYVFRSDSGWEMCLSKQGQRKHREHKGKTPADNVQTDLSSGDAIALIDPTYNKRLWFRFENRHPRLDDQTNGCNGGNPLGDSTLKDAESSIDSFQTSNASTEIETFREASLIEEEWSEPWNGDSEDTTKE